MVWQRSNALRHSSGFETPTGCFPRDSLLALQLSQQCLSPRRHISRLFSRKFRQFLFSAGKKQLMFQFNFALRYICDVLYIYNPDIEDYLRMYQKDLEIKHLLPTLICFHKLGGAINFRVPLTTNVKFSFFYYVFSFLSSSYIIFLNFCPPVAFSFHS